MTLYPVPDLPDADPDIAAEFAEPAELADPEPAELLEEPAELADPAGSENRTGTALETVEEGSYTRAARADVWTVDREPSRNRTALSAVSKLREVWTPPALWSDGLPPLRELWLYAVAGQWTRTDVRTPARVAGVVYGGLVVALSFVGYLLLWVAARPSRAIVAAVAGVLAVLTFLIF